MGIIIVDENLHQKGLAWATVQRQSLWNHVHFTTKELILRKVTQPGQKFKVSIFPISSPDHCTPRCLVMCVISMYLGAVLGARLC